MFNSRLNALADYIDALRMAWNEGDKFPSTTLHRIAGKAIDFLETTAAPQSEDGHQAGIWREKLEKGDYEELLTELSGKVVCCKRIG